MDCQWVQARLPARDGVLGIRLCLRFQFPPLWLQLLARFLSRLTLLKTCIKSELFLLSHLSTWSARFRAVLESLPTNRPFWHRPGVLQDNSSMDECLFSILYHGLFFGCQFSAHWRLAICTPHCLFWPETEWRNCQSGCGSKVGPWSLHSTRVQTVIYSVT